MSAPKFTFIWAKRGATLEFEQALQEGVGLGLKPTILWTSHGVMNGASLVLFDFLEGESYVPIRDFFDRIKQLLGDEQPVDLVGAACSLRYARMKPQAAASGVTDDRSSVLRLALWGGH